MVYKSALTKLETITSVEVDIAVLPYETTRYSLVKLIPKTERLHQLRIHTNKISHSLIGDTKYGDCFHNSMFQDNFNCFNLFLHAKEISFKHPFTNKKIVIEADLSKDWHKIFNTFKWKPYI